MKPDINTIWLASFDIGKKNFSFCIEQVHMPTIQNIENIPISQRFTKSGSCTEQFENLLEKINKCGKIILLKNIDITKHEEEENKEENKSNNKKSYINPQWFLNLTNILDSFLPYWQNCTAFVIEQQMSFGKKHNTLALKLGQHCMSYFLFHFANFKLTLEFPAYHKTRIHGASRKLTKYQRKQWAVDKALNMLISKDDNEILKIFTNLKKKDDAADALIMLNAYKFLCFVDKSL